MIELKLENHDGVKEIAYNDIKDEIIQFCL